MFKRITVSILIASALVLSACASPTASPTPVPTTPVTLPTVAPTETLVPTTQSSPTPTVAPTSVPGNLPDIGASNYLDDRSTPAALMLSYFNALNRQEYLRAYAYYQDTTSIGTFDEFMKGYADLQSVSVVFGAISSEGAAGSIYYTVPMILNSIQTSGAQQKYAACYILRLPQPANFTAPPITPMHIDHGTAANIPLATSDTAALASACTGADYPTGPISQPAAVENITDISKANYIDNRSDPISVISSLMNAVNSRQYVRAYSYWQTPDQTYNVFNAGYFNTQSVTVQFGTPTSNPGAGQLYYSLPTVLHSTLKDGTQQTFVGCYEFHLSQPAIQATPPFAPLGIISGKFTEVANDADVTSMLATACQP